MIDWSNLLANALWIMGCSLGLAALSYAGWEASLFKQKTSARLKRPKLQFLLGLAGLLFSLGLAASSETALKTGLWLVLGGLFLILMIAALLRQRSYRAS